MANYIQAAYTQASREIDFTADGLGVCSGVRVCSEDLERKYAAVGQDVSLRTARVPAVTLESILEPAATPRIDFLSIDTEGNELDVLSGLDLSKHRPTVIIAEANDGSGAAALKRAMKERGYVFLRRIGNVNYAFTCDRAVARRARHVSLRRDPEPLVHPGSGAGGHTACLSVACRIRCDPPAGPWRTGNRVDGPALRFDPHSLLHHNHIASPATGQYREVLRPAEIRAIEDECGEWMTRWRLSTRSPSPDDQAASPQARVLAGGLI